MGKGKRVNATTGLYKVRLFNVLSAGMSALYFPSQSEGLKATDRFI